MSGKGCKRIPAQVPHKQFADNWELAFGKKTVETDTIKIKQKTTPDDNQDDKSLDSGC